MKRTIYTLALTCLCFSLSMEAVVKGERFKQSEKAVKLATYGHIDAKGLISLMDSNVPFVLLDARGDDWKDGTIIPGAKFASYKNSLKQISQIIPHRHSLIVVYCYSFNCPFSAKLANKLIGWGYTNVVEYPAGLTEWRDVANYPVEAMYRTQKSYKYELG